MNKRDLIWGYSAQLLNIGAGLLILPILVVTLSSEELGLWYVFMAMAGLAQLLEFGFQPTIARQVAYVYNGAVEIKKIGLPESGVRGVANDELLINVVHASKIIYRIISLLAALLLLGFGSLYIYTLGYVGHTSIYISWFTFAFATITTFYFGYYNALLQGRGDVTLVNKVIVVSRLSLILIAVPLLLLGFGLFAMSLATLASCVINRLLANRSFYNAANKYLKGIQPTKNVTDVLWGSSWRLGLVQFGSFMIQRGNMFIAASFLGLSAAASYGLTLQISMLVMIFATQVISLQLPTMNTLQANGSKDELAKIFSASIVSSAMIVSLSFAVILLFGTTILSLMDSKTSLISNDLLIVFFVIILFETNHSICATYLTTKNKVPFLVASIASGAGVITLSSYLVIFENLGVLGLVLGQGLIQLLFNNWYWPKMAMMDLELDFKRMILIGFRTLKSIMLK